MTVMAWVHGRSVPSGTNLVRLLDFLRQFEPGLQNEDLLPTSEAPEPAAAAEERS
jgi:hypothetical protein